MEIYELQLEKIIPYTRNQKKHDKQQINNVAQSLSEFGWVQPVVVDKDNNIIIGHCRILAAQKLAKSDPKYKSVPVVKLEDLTPEEANKLRLLDNKLNESEWDMELLAEDVPDLDFFGYDIDWQLPTIEDDVEVIEDEFDEEPPEEPKAKLGDIYQLGEHRLMCGDSTSVEAVAELCNGEKVDLYLTDPPYNVDYTGKTKDALKIENDKKDDASFRQFLVDAFSAASAVMKAGAVFYIWHADSEGYNFRGACHDIRWQVRECLIWLKNVMVMGRQDYQWKHEPCLYGWQEGGSHAWYSDRKQTTILEFDRPTRNKEHPTMKPVALFDYLIRNSSKAGDIVLDSFGGSGTSIIACEQNGRRCFTMELDPSNDIGYTAPQIARMTMKSGQLYLPNGSKAVYGEGIYFANSRSRSIVYGKTSGNMDKTCVMAAKFKPGTKTISTYTARSQAQAEIRSGSKLGRALSKCSDPSSVYALCKGYQAMDNGSGYLVVLDRSCLAMSTNITAI